MAPHHGRRSNRALVAVFNRKEGYLVFRFDVKGLFSAEQTAAQELRPLPCPFARFPTLPIFWWTETMAIAASSKSIIAASSMCRTIVYDTARSQSSPGPALRAKKMWPILLPVPVQGRRGRETMMLVAAEDLFLSASPHFEALVHHRHRRGGGWRAVPLPRLPPLPAAGTSRLPRRVGGYFAAGARVWLSVDGEGTCSLDPRRRCWRVEGGWELPVDGRAEYVPELGLLLGLSCQRLRACDVRARPPVVLREWDECALRPEEEELYRYGVPFSYQSMAYLGGGRFCVSWTTPNPAPSNDAIDGRLLALTAVEVLRGRGGEMELRKHKSRCYRLSPGQTMAYML